jgi:hypothetical protein
MIFLIALLYGIYDGWDLIVLIILAGATLTHL